jgi:hypothetical protein
MVAAIPFFIITLLMATHALAYVFVMKDLDRSEMIYPLTLHPWLLSIILLFFGSLQYVLSIRLSASSQKPRRLALFSRMDKIGLRWDKAPLPPQLVSFPLLFLASDVHLVMYIQLSLVLPSPDRSPW